MLADSSRQKLTETDASGIVGESRRIDVRAMLRHCSIRPTRQRLSLASFIFGKGDRHVTADVLLSEARAAGVRASYATIYNVLRCFADAGLVRYLAVEGHPTIFDTNTRPHHHFFFEDSAKIADLSFGDVTISGMPQPPEGYEISRIDVVVRLRPTKKASRGTNA